MRMRFFSVPVVDGGEAEGAQPLPRRAAGPGGGSAPGRRRDPERVGGVRELHGEARGARVGGGGGSNGGRPRGERARPTAGLGRLPRGAERGRTPGTLATATTTWAFAWPERRRALEGAPLTRLVT